MTVKFVCSRTLLLASGASSKTQEEPVQEEVLVRPGEPRKQQVPAAVVHGGGGVSLDVVALDMSHVRLQLGRTLGPQQKPSEFARSVDRIRGFSPTILKTTQVPKRMIARMEEAVGSEQQCPPEFIRLFPAPGSVRLVRRGAVWEGEVETLGRRFSTGFHDTAEGAIQIRDRSVVNSCRNFLAVHVPARPNQDHTR